MPPTRKVLLYSFCIFTPIITIRSLAIMYAAALETKSSHPVAAAIVNRFSGCITDKIEEFGSQINLPDVTKFKNEDGMGLSGVAVAALGGDEKSVEVLVGNLDLMKLYKVDVRENEIEILNEWASHGKTVVFIAINGQVGNCYTSEYAGSLYLIFYHNRYFPIVIVNIDSKKI